MEDRTEAAEEILNWGAIYSNLVETLGMPCQVSILLLG